MTPFDDLNSSTPNDCALNLEETPVLRGIFLTEFENLFSSSNFHVVLYSRAGKLYCEEIEKLLFFFQKKSETVIIIIIIRIQRSTHYRS